MTRRANVSSFVGRLAVLAIMGSVLAACASGRTPGSAPGSSGERDPLEITCEMALVRLERLISERSSQRDFSAAALAEATELYSVGRELYLEREYELALEFIQEGIELVEEASD